MLQMRNSAAAILRLAKVFAALLSYGSIAVYKNNYDYKKLEGEIQYMQRVSFLIGLNYGRKWMRCPF